MTSQLMMMEPRREYVDKLYTRETGIPFIFSMGVDGGEFKMFHIQVKEVIDIDEYACMQEQLVAEWLVSR